MKAQLAKCSHEAKAGSLTAEASSHKEMAKECIRQLQSATPKKARESRESFKKCQQKHEKKALQLAKEAEQLKAKGQLAVCEHETEAAQLTAEARHHKEMAEGYGRELQTHRSIILHRR